VNEALGEIKGRNTVAPLYSQWPIARIFRATLYVESLARDEEELVRMYCTVYDVAFGCRLGVSAR